MILWYDFTGIEDVVEQFEKGMFLSGIQINSIKAIRESPDIWQFNIWCFKNVHNCHLWWDWDIFEFFKRMLHNMRFVR